MDSELNLENTPYPISNDSKGLAYIFSNSKFHPTLEYPERSGNQEDEWLLQTTLTKLGYFPTIHKDLTISGMTSELVSITSSTDFTGCDSLLLFFLSHGKEGAICAYDGEFSIDEISKYFKGEKCQSLIGKPKLMFFICCQGKNVDKGIAFDETDRMEPRRNFNAEISQPTPRRAESRDRVPIEADFLYCYSTVKGYCSFRNSEKGTLYTRTLCEILESTDVQGMDIYKLLTKVNYRISRYFESRTEDEATNGCKQCAHFFSTLRRPLVLVKKQSKKKKKLTEEKIDRMKITEEKLPPLVRNHKEPWAHRVPLPEQEPEHLSPANERIFERLCRSTTTLNF